MKNEESQFDFEEEEDEELVEMEKLNEEKPWELAFERGAAMANEKMIEEDWEEDEDFV